MTTYEILATVFLFVVWLMLVLMIISRTKEINNLRIVNSVLNHNLQVTQQQLVEMHEQSVELIESLLKSKLAKEIIEDQNRGNHRES